MSISDGVSCASESFCIWSTTLLGRSASHFCRSRMRVVSFWINGWFGPYSPDLFCNSTWSLINCCRTRITIQESWESSPIRLRRNSLPTTSRCCIANCSMFCPRAAASTIASSVARASLVRFWATISSLFNAATRSAAGLMLWLSGPEMICICRFRSSSSELIRLVSSSSFFFSAVMNWMSLPALFLWIPCISVR